MKSKLNRRDFMRTTAAATGGLAFSQLAMTAPTRMKKDQYA